MNLKQLIYKRLIGSEILTGLLAIYQDKPAVFDTEAPADQQGDWGGRSQYPRITYTLDMQANEERSSVGTLSVTVYAERTNMVILEITAGIKECLRDILLNPTEDGPYGFGWARTDGFTIPGMNVIGQTITFDIVEYPDQLSTDPDPAVAMERYLKKLYPDSIVLGLDRIDEIVETGSRPVVYCEIQTISRTSGRNMNVVSWLDCRMAIHILCPNAKTNLQMCTAIQQNLALDEVVIMLDDSPMHITDLKYDAKADYLRIGQLSVTVRYGVLKVGPKPHTITKNVISEGGTNG